MKDLINILLKLDDEALENFLSDLENSCDVVEEISEKLYYLSPLGFTSTFCAIFDMYRLKKHFPKENAAEMFDDMKQLFLAVAE